TSAKTRRRMPPRPETRRRGHPPGLQPGVVVACPVEADEGRAGARRCTGAVDVQHWRVPPAARRVLSRHDRPGAVSCEVAAAWRVEGRRLQRVVRRNVQRAAAPARPPLRLASPRVLPPVTVHFSKGHASGNDFIYVRDQDAAGMAHDVLARELCDRHTGIGGDGLILYTATDDGASMRLFNADGSRSEVSGNGVRGLAALLLRGGPKARLTIETEGGTKQLEWIARDRARYTFRAAMGLPVDLRRVTVTAAGEQLA